MKHFLLLSFLLSMAWAGPDEDWAEIQATEKGPQIGADAMQARSVALSFLTRQEEQLRRFTRLYPQDERSLDAQLRLAHVMAVKGDLTADPKPGKQAFELLDHLEKVAPAKRQADVAFVRVSMFMRTLDSNQGGIEQQLLGRVQAFSKAYPQDRRIAALLAETATMFDRQPGQKRRLLEQALALSNEGGLRERIQDDLRRLDLMTHPLVLDLELLDGSRFALQDARGEVYVICFFAEWSPPSMRALEKVKAAIEAVGDVRGVGVSLDRDKSSVLDRLKKLRINWPVSLQVEGWESPMVRSLGINALPTVWLVDRKGFVHVSRADAGLEAMLRQLVR